MIRASDHPDRTEAIRVSVVSSQVEEFSLSIPFEKEGDKFIFGDEKFDEPPNNILLPIKNVWKKG